MKISIIIIFLSFCFAGPSYGFVSDLGSRECELVKESDHHLSLPAGCTYRKTIKIEKSETSLNCNGSVIDARSINIGILVEGNNIHDVDITNCRIYGAKGHGILIRSSTSSSQLQHEEISKRYAIAPENISVSNSTISASGAVGIFIGFYSQKVKVTDSTIEGSGGVGLYLEASSIHNEIRRNYLLNNGFGDVARGGKPLNREAIAIDSSAYNNISQNFFFNNSAGSLFLYKNCGENKNNPRSVPRWQHSNFNRIDRNLFIEKGIAIYIASRQLKDLTHMQCIDQPLIPGFYRDYSSFNIVERNVIIGTRTGLIVQDDFNTLYRNIFISNQSCVILGSKRRRYLLPPIMGTVLLENRCVIAKEGFVTNGSSFFDYCSRNYIGRSDFVCKPSSRK